MKDWWHDDSSRIIDEILRGRASPQIFLPENSQPDRGDKNVTDETMRHNTGKPQLSHLLEFDGALDELARVCEHGAAKYARGNWKKGGPNASLESLTDSALRHAKKRMNGEVFDTDPKMHGQVRHLAQVAWNALAALYHELEAEKDAEAKD